MSALQQNQVTIQPRAWAFGLFALFLVCFPSISHAKTVKWDTQADWAKGSASKVTWGKTPGEIKLIFDPSSVKKTPYIYLPNSGLNTLVQMDTRTGKINWTYNLAVHNLGSSPSRTTVDSKGNVWVGLRNGSHVIAISSKGKYITAINVGSGPRAVTIDRDGHIWAGGYYAQGITQISGITYKVMRVVKNAAICAYGAATDSIGNIWTMNRCKNTVTKINATTGAVIGHYPAYSGYGIAADRIGNVWVASYSGAVAYQYRASDGKLIKSYPLGARGRGVSVDSKNRIWVACSNTTSGSNVRHVNRIDPATGQILKFTNVGLHTIGIAIDSAGFVWANSYVEGKAYKLKVADGSFVASYNICDTTGTRPCANSGCKRCTNPNQSQPYTYSDMTGFQLQTSPAKGTWNAVFDAKCKASFSNISWGGSLPAKTNVRVRARSAATRAGLNTAAWGLYVLKGQALKVASNRFLEVQFFLETPDSRISPTVTFATLTYDHFKEVCDGIDNDCDGSTDEGFPDLGKPCKNGKGLCQRSGTFACKPDRTGTYCPAKPGTPSQEICDNKDNNCNGLVDENWPQKNTKCSVGVGGCNNIGTLVCQAGGKLLCSVSPRPPKPEVCDGIDNNCNGQTDENLIQRCTTACGAGQKKCTNGNWSKCNAPAPKAELCNDLDDDCDGQVDETLSRKCKTLCGEGNEECKNGKWVFCSAKQPKEEVCDGVDNDCNGQVDDGLKSKKCSGACGIGTAVCQGGKWSGCSGPQPKDEICDGKDNDCDGVVDGIVRPCRSKCGPGNELCQSGKWKLCTAPQPQPELCDGRDTDCDGNVDNKAKCPAGMICKEGQCQLNCRNGECPGGARCAEGICEGNLCAKIKCEKGKECLSGRCTNLCDLVKCPSGYACDAGKCIKDDCYRKGCPSKQQCVSGVCVADPCLGVSCSADQFCREGKCIDSCASVSCQKGQKCKDGKCVNDPKTSGPCENIQCPQGQDCKNGKCIYNPCTGTQCPTGRVCVSGICDHDLCLNIKCPGSQKCKEGQCYKGVTPKEENPTTDAGSAPDKSVQGGDHSGGKDEASGKSDHKSQGGPEGKVQVDNISADQVIGGKNNKPNAPDNSRYSSGCGCQTEDGQTPFWAFFGMILFFGTIRFRYKSSK